MISTQPGSTPVSSFKVLSLDEYDGYSNGKNGPLRSDCGLIKTILYFIS